MQNIDRLLSISFIATIFIPLILLFVIKPTREAILDEFEYGVAFPFAALLYLIIAFFAFIIITFPVLKSISLNTSERTEIKTTHSETNIKSLYLNNEAEQILDKSNKPFSLGISMTNTTSYFYYFSEEDGRYRLDKACADETYIEETNDINPKIISDTETEVLITEFNVTSIGKILGLEKEVTEKIVTQKTENTIYIPVGSLIENYNPALNN